MTALDNALARYEWWQRASARERAMLAGGVAIVALVLLAVWVVQPMLDTLRQAPAQRALRKAQLAQAQQRVAAIGSIKPVAPVPLDVRASVDRALQRQHLGGADASVDVADARVGVTLPAVRVADVAALLDTLARDGLRATDVTLASRADSPLVRAELGFTRPAR